MIFGAFLIYISFDQNDSENLLLESHIIIACRNWYKISVFFCSHGVLPGQSNSYLLHLIENYKHAEGRFLFDQLKS